MGKKDKKDPAKADAKKARQAAKQQKTSTKRNKKEAKELGEDDIDTILAEFAKKDAIRTAVTVTQRTLLNTTTNKMEPEPPSPRSNFSLTSLPNGDLIMFGGEFCDGERTTVYNELLIWNIERNEWKQVESINTPSPRCSHQAVVYKDKLYIFGGEYATLDQFHHYKDLWVSNVNVNTILCTAYLLTYLCYTMLYYAIYLDIGTGSEDIRLVRNKAEWIRHAQCSQRAPDGAMEELYCLVWGFLRSYARG